MIRRLIIAALIAPAVFLTSFAGAADAPAAAAKPNVLLILSDDIGWGEFGFQGNKDVPTPNIDTIASNGVKFTNAYVAATVCSPSRAGLMTGRYPTSFGHEFNIAGQRMAANSPVPLGIPLTETLFPQRMKSLGYATCAIGKWHIGADPAYLPTSRGFDEFYGTPANTTYRNPRAFVDTRKSPEITSIQDPDFYTTEAYTARAIDYIGQQKAGRPYFLYLAFNADHGPLTGAAPKKYTDRFPDIKDPKRKDFAGAMSALDDAVGAVLKKVRDSGQEENTLVIFFSDNGGPTWQTTASNLPLHGSKGNTSEGGIRIPFCVQWKGKIPSGKVYDAPIINLDLLPTAIAAAGGQVDPAWKLHGVDLLPYVTGANPATPHEALYWRFGDQWAVRKGDWKLVSSNADGKDAGQRKPKLINLAEDISESNDLAAKNPDKLKELQTLWTAWSDAQHAPLWKSPGLGKRGADND